MLVGDGVAVLEFEFVLVVGVAEERDGEEDGVGVGEREVLRRDLIVDIVDRRCRNNVVVLMIWNDDEIADGRMG